MGKLYKGGGLSQQKGAVKQERWIASMQAALGGAQVDGRMRKLIERMGEFDNVPRKQKPFANFVKARVAGCARHVHRARREIAGFEPLCRQRGCNSGPSEFVVRLGPAHD